MCDAYWISIADSPYGILQSEASTLCRQKQSAQGIFVFNFMRVQGVGNRLAICIIGPNGGGKSTLLKMIAGMEKCDSGTVSIRKDARVAYLDQTSPDQKDGRIVEDILRDSFAELLQIEHELNRAYEEMADASSLEEYERMAGRISRPTSSVWKSGQRAWHRLGWQQTVRP